jgi:hypothetical protein
LISNANFDEYGNRDKKNPNKKWIQGNDEKLLKKIKDMSLIMTMET